MSIDCSCNVVNTKEFKEAGCRACEKRAGHVTPGAIWNELGKEPQCGRCTQTLIKIAEQIKREGANLGS